MVLVYRCRFIKGAARVTGHGDIGEVGWFKTRDLPSPMSASVAGDRGGALGGKGLSFRNLLASSVQTASLGVGLLRAVSRLWLVRGARGGRGGSGSASAGAGAPASGVLGAGWCRTACGGRAAFQVKRGG